MDGIINKLVMPAVGMMINRALEHFDVITKKINLQANTLTVL